MRAHGMAPGSMARLLFVGLLLLLGQGALTQGGPVAVPVRLSVESDLSDMISESYSSHVVKGGVLLGALRRLQDTEQNFKFTVKEDPDFGLLLESVNGVAGSEAEHTYWEILSEASGEYTRMDVGIGCHRPKANEHIILRLSTWSKQ